MKLTIPSTGFHLKDYGSFTSKDADLLPRFKHLLNCWGELSVDDKPCEE
jgi:hypothetical protein